MKYRMISPEAARAVKQYIIPGVEESPDFDEYFFYAAIQDNGGLTGLLVIDPAQSGMVVRSIGMSPEFCNKGYGSELLRYAMRDIATKLKEANVSSVELRAGFSTKSGKEDQLSAYLYKNGFLMEDECPVYRIPLAKAMSAPILKDATKREKPEGLHSLKDIPNPAVNAFSNKVLHEGLFPSIRRQGLDPEVSVCFMPGKEILGCALFEETADDTLQNVWVYVSNDASAANKMIFLLMLAECLRQALKKYKPTTQICILAVEDVSKDLLHKVFPGEKPVHTLQSHMRLLLAPMDGPMDDDPVFEEVLSA